MHIGIHIGRCSTSLLGVADIPDNDTEQWIFQKIQSSSLEVVDF
jgi:hypothetical protein